MASIVVLDSEDTVRTVMSSILKKGGHTVRASSRLEDALPMLREALPDLVISNVFLLGGMAGHSAMEKVREEFPNVPYLMVSGLPDEDVFQKWRERPGFDVFPKPFTYRSLLDKVDEMLSTGMK